MAALKIGKRRIRFRFLIFLSILFAIGYYFCNIQKRPAAYALIGYGELMTSHQAQALIVREEEVFPAPAYGKVTYFLSDSEMVEKEQLIARLYKENFNEDTLYQLYSVQEKIAAYQRDNVVDKLLDSDFKKINSDIDSVVLDIQSLIRAGDYPAIDKKENALRSLMSKKQEFIDIRSQPDDYLKSLYEQESDLTVKLNDWVVDIKAPKAGIISYYVDGLENILGLSSLDKLNFDDFRQLINNPQHKSEEQGNNAEAQQPFFKIVDPDTNWYAILETDSEVYYEKGDQVNVQVFTDTEFTLTGTVYRVQKDNTSFKGKKRSLVVLEMNNHIAPVINKRTVTLKITQTVEGFIVPKKALSKHKRKTGIWVLDRGSKVFIEVYLKGVTDNHAVVAPVSLNQELNKNDRVIVD